MRKRNWTADEKLAIVLEMKVLRKSARLPKFAGSIKLARRSITAGVINF